LVETSKVQICIVAKGLQSILFKTGIEKTLHSVSYLLKSNEEISTIISGL